jgi:hypothetical protein
VTGARQLTTSGRPDPRRFQILYRTLTRARAIVALDVAVERGDQEPAPVSGEVGTLDNPRLRTKRLRQRCLSKSVLSTP